MKKFKKWLMSCKQNRIEAIQNIGFLLFVSGLIVCGIVQFTPAMLLQKISIWTFSIGGLIWIFGMVVDEIREKQNLETF